MLKVDSSTNVHGVTLPRLTSMQYYWVARRDGRTTSEPHDNAPAAEAAEAADASGPKASRPPAPATSQFMAEGSVDYYNLLTAEDLKAGRSEFTRVVSNTMSFTVVVSNSCYLLRLVPTTEGAIQYQEAGSMAKRSIMCT